MVSGAPYVPTKHEKVAQMLELAKLQEHEKVVDLGSGDGRIVFAAADQCNHATGVEISPSLHWISKVKLKKKKLKNVSLIRNSLWNVDLSKYDIVFIYFIPHRMKKLSKKIKKESE